MIEKFKKYVDKFPKEKGIVYKYNHSLRVMKICEEIGKSLKLTKEQLEAIKIMGLLHDFARFEQWMQYKSFNDLTTFDHGERSSQLLFDENKIKDYNLDKKYYNIVSSAIKNHNKYSIPKMTNKEEELFSKIIRDADKLDILNKFTKSLLYEEDNGQSIHKSVEQYFFKHLPVRTPIKRTDNDLIIVKLAFIYDFNFSYSFKYIKKHKIIDRIEKGIDNKLFAKYIKETKKYMEGKIC
ncbi:MAG: HD domain-containing protein [Bacilli bacterium]|nr:HD domain-containing protein [Bacilli bacterium]